MNQVHQPAYSPVEPDTSACRALMARGCFQDALLFLTQILKTNATDTDVMLLASDCYWDMGRSDRSLQILETLLQENLQDIRLLARLGSRMLSMGEKEAAVQAFEAALSIQPDNINLICALDLAIPTDPSGPRASRLRKAVKNHETDPSDQEAANNTLGRMAERVGRYGDAIAYFQRSKDCIAVPYDTAKFENLVKSQTQTNSMKSMPPASGTRTSNPMFIMGVPRSGTTLLDAILSRHSDVTSIGESVALEVTRKGAQANVLASGNNWDWCQDLSAQQREQSGDLYQRIASQSLVGERPPWIIDKMPYNIFDAGFAAQILPGARFVYMRRHPLDIGVSLLANNFPSKLSAFTKKQEWIAHYILLSERSAEDFAQKLGARFHMQSYRALVQDPEYQIKGVLDTLGLAWESSVLAPNRSDLAMKTASVMQVREDINQKGLERWRNYEAYIQPMIDALGGWGWIRDWEEKDAEYATQEALMRTTR